jgi:hypothetical protein
VSPDKKLACCKGYLKNQPDLSSGDREVIGWLIGRVDKLTEAVQQVIHHRYEDEPEAEPHYKEDPLVILLEEG